MSSYVRRSRRALWVLALVGGLVSCTTAPDPAAVEALFAEARRFDADGRHDDAIAVYRRLLAQDPDSFDGHYWIARALDLVGQYDDARDHFSRAIELSPESNRDQTLRMMGIAWTFASDADNASHYFRQVFDRRLAAGNPAGAAEVANELGRMYLELGDIDRAETWYRTGYETAAQESGRTRAQVDLADLRWAHAQARLAVRRGRAAEARQHVAAVRALVDKATNADQEVQLAYLRGYVALHLDDAAGAIAALQDADQSDPFILLMVARAHEQEGDLAMAREYYAKVLASTSHAVTAAIARPVARQRIGR